uniref:Uncharacterized protein n=1 Tax=Tanacetum cinerariifolium TaxID=118510 RepID=A0A699HJG7_TANCI|nr:hypothetical protein [Tanacetum cinerariifolium]
MVSIEYEWKPPRCELCTIFGHVHDQCPKKVMVTSTAEKVNDGFQTVTKKRKKGKSRSTNGGLFDGQLVKQNNQSLKAIVPPASPRRSPNADEGVNITVSNSYAALDDESEEEVENLYDELANLLKSTKTGERLSTFTVVQLFSCLDKISYIEWALDSEYILYGLYKKPMIQARSLAQPEWTCKIDEACIPVQWPKHASKGVSFTKDGSFAAICTRRDCKDYVNLISCHSWEIMGVFAVDTLDLADVEWSPDDSAIVIWDSPLEYKVLIYSLDGRNLGNNLGWRACASSLMCLDTRVEYGPQGLVEVRYDIMELPITLLFQKPPADKPNPKQGISAYYVNVPLPQFSVMDLKWDFNGSCLLLKDKDSFCCVAVPLLPDDSNSDYSSDD